MRITHRFFTTQPLPQLIIFDMDNTIAFREHHFAQAMIETLDTLDMRHTFTIANIHNAFLGMSIEQCWQKLQNTLLHDKTIEAQHSTLSILKNEYIKRVKDLDTQAHKKKTLFISDTIQIIQWCYEKKIATCIVSGSSRDEIAHIIKLGSLPITQYWGAEDYTPHSKPSPLPYEIAVTAFQNEFKNRRQTLNRHHIIVLEDSIAGAQSAAAAGLHCIVRCNDSAYQEKLRNSIAPEIRIVEHYDPMDMTLLHSTHTQKSTHNFLQDNHATKPRL